MSKIKIFNAGHIFNPLETELPKSELKNEFIGLSYPTRLVPVPLDPKRLALQDGTSFAGEILVSVDQPIKVDVKYLGNNNGNMQLNEKCERKALVKHAYGIMCQKLGVSPSLSIDVDENGIIKHGGLGSNGAMLGAVCSAINELYGNPISELDLTKYIVTNYGEPIDDERLSQNTCIGGSVATGLSDGGVIVVAGQGVPIGKANYYGNAIIGIPNDYVPPTSEKMTQWEEEMFDEITKETDVYGRESAYKLIHDGLPKMVRGDISGVADLSFNYTFGDRTPPFAYWNTKSICNAVRGLYENCDCDMMGISSVSPTFFALANNPEKIKKVIETFQRQDLKTKSVPVCNTAYTITGKG